MEFTTALINLIVALLGIGLTIVSFLVTVNSERKKESQPSLENIIIGSNNTVTNDCSQHNEYYCDNRTFVTTTPPSGKQTSKCSSSFIILLALLALGLSQIYFTTLSVTLSIIQIDSLLLAIFLAIFLPRRTIFSKLFSKRIIFLLFSLNSIFLIISPRLILFLHSLGFTLSISAPPSSESSKAAMLFFQLLFFCPHLISQCLIFLLSFIDIPFLRKRVSRWVSLCWVLPLVLFVITTVSV